MTLPISYESQNLYNSLFQPSTVHYDDNKLFAFYFKWLLHKSFSLFEWDLPDTWEDFGKDYFLSALYGCGIVAVFYHKDYGYLFGHCNLYGKGVFYQPTNAIVTNWIYGTLDMRIGEECRLIKLLPTYGGLLDIIAHYARKCSVATSTALINLYNSRLSYLFMADSKAMAETQKAIFDEVMSGNLAAFTTKGSIYDDQGNRRIELFVQNVKNNFIANECYEMVRNYIDEFCSFIGIPSNGYEKKERMLNQEITNSNATNSLLYDLMYDSLNKSCERIRKDYGLKISVRKKFHEESTGNDLRNSKNGEPTEH